MISTPPGPAGVALFFAFLVFTVGVGAYLKLRADRSRAKGEPLDLTERLQGALKLQLDNMLEDVRQAREDAAQAREETDAARADLARCHRRIDRLQRLGAASDRHVAHLELILTEAKLTVPTRPALLQGHDPWGVE